MGLAKVELLELLVDLWNPMAEQIAWAKPFVLPDPDKEGNRDLQGRPFTLLWTWLMPFPVSIVRQAMELELAEARPDIRHVAEKAQALSPPADNRETEAAGPVRWEGDKSGICILNLLGDRSPFALHVKKWPYEYGMRDWEPWLEEAIRLLRLGQTSSWKIGGAWFVWKDLIPKYERRLAGLRKAKAESEDWRARRLFLARLGTRFAQDREGAAMELSEREGISEVEILTSTAKVRDLLP